jgi:hypothetical protein
MAGIRSLRPLDSSDAMAQHVTRDLRSLLVAIVGDAYALHAALPAGSHRAAAGELEATAIRAAILIDQLAHLVGLEPLEPVPPEEAD